MTDPAPKAEQPVYAIVRASDGLYWTGGGWTAQIDKAILIPNPERQHVRLAPGEQWEKKDA